MAISTSAWKDKNRMDEDPENRASERSAESPWQKFRKDTAGGTEEKTRSKSLQIPMFGGKKVHLKELALYSRQLSVLIDSELPLIQSLNILAEQTKNKYFSQVITKVREDVEAGASLNQAKRKFPKVFDDLYCNLIASGEQSGALDTMLKRLSDFLEGIVKLRAKIKQAMVYPASIMAFSFLVIIFMLWKVVPVFAKIFIDLGAELPVFTQVIMAASGFLQKYMLFFVIGIVVLIFLAKNAKQTDGGRRFFDVLALRMPLFGKIINKVGLSRVTRTLSTLLSGGIPMMEALKITSSTAGNVTVEDKIMRARTLVSEGKSLTDAFREVGHFPFMLTQMMSVGENTGNLDEMLSKSADFYDDEVDASVSTLLSLLEPILLITVGGMVGFLVISMYLPIFSLMQKI